MAELASRCVGVEKFSSTYVFIRLQEFYYAALRETISSIFVKKAILIDPLNKQLAVFGKKGGTFAQSVCLRWWLVVLNPGTFKVYVY